MDRPILKLTGISKSFSGVKVLNNISLEILPGTIYCLAGENGCGKSTLIKIISGVYSADAGTIELDGRMVKRMTPQEAMNGGIEVIYQDFSVFPNLTVAENIVLNTEITERRKLVNWKSVTEQAQAALDKIGVKIPLDAMVETLPVASRQLIAISRALAHNVRILIMDEPTTALTKKEVDALFSVVKGLNRSGISVIFVSHKMDEVMQLSHRIIVIRNGEQVAEGESSSFSKERLVYCMTGRHISQGINSPTPREEAPVVLRVQDISQKGGFNNISFDLKKHEIIGITGLLGSGRTALANALFGIRKIDSGKILLDDQEIHLKNVRSAVRHWIAYVPEDRLTEGLFLDQSIDLNIVITVLNKIKTKIGSIDHRRVKSFSADWINALHIKAQTGAQPARTLSGGNQQKIVIAKWLATDPKVLILNGPTAGVDIGAKTDIIQLIRSLAEDGMSIILASDDVSEILACCDRIFIMSNGRIVKQVKTDETSERELNEMIRGKETQ